MRRAAIDQAIERREVQGFAFPLGVYPLETMNPTPGYTVQFEPADGGDGPGDFLGSAGFDDWEEWPDRFVYDVLVPVGRLRALSRALIAMLPGRIYPILDVLGSDSYREIDPYLAYELVGIERFYDGLREWDDWLFEDGLVGFGAMSVDPFIYVFIDEHKIITIRAELAFKDRIERLLAAFDLAAVEEIKGADSSEHEHRGVLVRPDDRSDLVTADEIIERLRDAWGLQLNVDATTNVDDDGNELGVTAWQCVVRCSAGREPEATEPSSESPARGRAGESSDDDSANSDSDETLAYAEILLSAECLEAAERMAAEAAENLPGTPEDGWVGLDVIKADRITPEQLAEWLAASPGGAPKARTRKSGSAGKATSQARASEVHDARWLVAPGEKSSSGEPGESAS
jgi:hypothetical protein